MQRNDSATTDGIARTPSRRAVLSLGAAGVVSTLAGCSAITGNSTSEPNQSEDRVIVDHSFEGPELVVELREDHDIERLNLIGPEGSLFASRNLAAGATKAQIQILDIEWGIGGYEHYTPGSYELTAVNNGESIENYQFDLKPDLRILGVSERTHRDREIIDSLEVEIKNTGTGPTWVYDIAYPELEEGSTSTLGENPGVPQSYLASPDDEAGVILPPNGSETFASRDTPFRFKSNNMCSGESITGAVAAGTPTGVFSERRFEATFTGEAMSESAFSSDEEYYCTDASAELIEQSENDT